MFHERRVKPNVDFFFPFFQDEDEKKEEVTAVAKQHELVEGADMEMGEEEMKKEAESDVVGEVLSRYDFNS